MHRDYLMRRMAASLAMANRAVSSAAREIHLDLARRYDLALAKIPAHLPADVSREERSWAA